MKKAITILLAATLTLVPLLTACGAAEKQDTTPTETTESIQLPQLPDITSDTFAFDTLTAQNVKALIEDLTYTDSIAASPFYTPESFKALFKDKRIFDLRDTAIFDIYMTSELLQIDTETLIIHLDYLAPQTAEAYIEMAAFDSTLTSYTEQIKNDYADMTVALSLLAAQVESLGTSTRDPYQKAWEDALLLDKRIEYALTAATFYARVLADTVMLVDTYADNPSLDLFQDTVMDFLAMDLEFSETFAVNVDNIGARIYEIRARMEALDKADAYATVAALMDQYEIAKTLMTALETMTIRDGIDQETLDFVKEAYAYQIELTETFIEALIDLYELEVSLASLGDKARSVLSTTPGIGITHLSFAEVNASYKDEKGKSALEKANQVLSEPVPAAPKPNENFFKKFVSSVRKAPGVLLEKASTVVYKSAFSFWGSEYGLSEDEIQKEKDRAKAEELRRIEMGIAGKEALDNATKYIENVENAIGTISDTELGKDSTMSKVIKAGSKFAVGCFTGSSKAVIKLMDPQATLGELGKSALDVTLTVIGGSQNLSNLVKTKSSSMTTTLLGKAKNITSKFKDVTSSLLDDAVNLIKETPKIGTFFTKTGKALANASNKLTEKASTLFKNAWDDTAPYVTQVKDKVSAINKQTTITNPLIKDVYGSGVTELTESYVKGLAYDAIPTLIDETLPGVVVSYMESGDAPAVPEETTAEESVTEETTAQEATAEVTTSEKTTAEETTAEETTETTTAAPPTTEATTTAPSGGLDSAYHGTYTGAYKKSTIAGMAFDLNASNSRVTITVSATAIKVDSFIQDPMLDGSGVVFSTSNYVAKDGVVTFTNKDGDGDTQKITLRFGKDGTVTGTVGVYDGSDYLGDLNFTAK